ncbi:MAG: response regulator [Acidimicrobiales bacterium]
MVAILLATDSDALFEEVDAALASDDVSVMRVTAGADVLRVVEVKSPDLVLLDMQIGNQGGIATCIALRQEEGFDRLAHRPVALLLDRAADVYVAGQSGAEGWLVKPIDPLRLSRMVSALLAGQTHYEGVVASA